MNERRSERKSRHLGIAGLLLTIILSIGGTWITNLIHTNVNDTQIQTLIRDNAENKHANELVYALQADVGTLKRDVLGNQGQIRYLDNRIDGVEVNAARATEAIENLVKATNQLTETSNRLIVAVAKLEK